jgi:hypothetical protein
LTSKPVTTPSESEIESETPGELVDFIEQEDGTRIEVNKRPMALREEINREKGGRIYRVVSKLADISLHAHPE